MEFLHLNLPFSFLLLLYHLCPNSYLNISLIYLRDQVF